MPPDPPGLRGQTASCSYGRLLFSNQLPTSNFIETPDNAYFWAILWFINAFCFIFLFFSTRGINRNFVLSQNGVCGIEGTNMVNAEYCDRHYRTWYKDNWEFLSNSDQKSWFLRKTRCSRLEIARKCQFSKSTVAWRCRACMLWACIANDNFTQRVPNQIFESCFQPLESFPFICLRNNIMWHFLMLCVMSWSLLFA